MTATPLGIDRQDLVRRSQRLNWLTLAYNSLEGVLSFGAGLVAGSVVLVGFGIDSLIELTASAAALWRLAADADPVRREHAERVTHRVIGACFLALALYVAVEAIQALLTRSAPERSWIGIVIAGLSLAIMPILAHRKRQIGLQLRSGALVAEAKQTLVCMYLSAILLAGLSLHALLGWWWADPVAAIAMVPLIVREGIAGVRGRSPCADGCTPIEVPSRE